MKNPLSASAAAHRWAAGSWVLVALGVCWLVVGSVAAAEQNPLTGPSVAPEQTASEISPQPGEAPWTAVAADRELLNQVARDGELRGGSAMPGLAHYLRDLLYAFFKPLAEWMEAVGGPMGGLFAWFAGGGWRILALLVLSLVVTLIGLQVLRRWRRRAAAPAAEGVVEQTGQSSVAEIEAWEARLESRLERGETRAALEAMWWSLATRLVGRDADPAWTSRELVERAGRRDLLPSVRRLDRMVWGSELPVIEDVRQLWHRVREVVG